MTFLAIIQHTQVRIYYFEQFLQVVLLVEVLRKRQVLLADRVELIFSDLLC